MNDHLKNKLFYYEENPPAHVWGEIHDTLENNQLGKKLYKYEATPSSFIWEKIRKQIDEENKVQTLPTKNIRYLRYAGVAALFILLIYSVSIFVNKKSIQKDKMVTENTDNKKQGDTINLTTPFSSEETPKKIEDAISDPVARNKFAINRKIHRLPSEIVTTSIASQTIATVKEKIRHLDLANADRYMVYSDQAGNNKKLPRKLFDIVNCEEMDMVCKENLQKLQEKISTASLSLDFMGFVQMLKHVQEN